MSDDVSTPRPSPEPDATRRDAARDRRRSLAPWLVISLCLNALFLAIIGAMRFRETPEEPEDESPAAAIAGNRPPVNRYSPDADFTARIRAVDEGLQWLARHQSPDGSWDSDGFQAQCQTNVCDGKGNPAYDAGLTGLSLLAFIGAGYTHNFGKYKENVRHGLRYLTSVQDPEGCFGDRTAHNFTYGHAISTLAMTEALALTQFALFKVPAQKGLDFISKCRNPNAAWRYGVQPGDNDSSVTGWMVMALKSGESAGLQVNPDDYEGARDFIDSVTAKSGKVGYTQRGNGLVRLRSSEALTAIGVWSRVLLKEDPARSENILKGADLMLVKLPAWERQRLDFYYWYFGTLALRRVGGSHFAQWNKAMHDAVVPAQATDGDEKGSWPATDAWGEEGGRIYSTAILTLCLGVDYRR